MSRRSLWRGLYRKDFSPGEADFTILGIPFDKGCSFREGTCSGPEYIRSSSDRNPPVTEDGAQLTASVCDMGNIPFQDVFETQRDYFEKVQDQVEEIFKAKYLQNDHMFPIFLGGDHSITIPLLRAIDQVYKGDEEDIAIIHFDTHLDICDTLDENPLSHGSTHRRGWELDVFKPEHTYFVGIRCSEAQEHNFLHGKQTNIVTAKQIFMEGPLKMAQQIADLVGNRKTYLTLDIDVLDPAFAPGTGTPVAGGLSSRELLIMLEELSKLNLIGMDLVEVSPPWDNSEITLYSAQKIIFEMMGYMAPKDKKGDSILNQFSLKQTGSFNYQYYDSQA
ncbi:agmatinase [Natranaerobius thermophilus]|uniref:Agmatinase n=1 Tax=Natranaerobius thermophilus (strain ATCC BAA-1301 / DSM 18059 / JW/NM-WN-LF) TaxID=457570 RepID=B2A2U1_NATTJ|nr:agmatinase [Natranaerobius thermophilus]ACB86309.1 agmatinase [Natranaerobius thermophilus JW/NM-WN-LF]